MVGPQIRKAACLILVVFAHVSIIQFLLLDTVNLSVQEIGYSSAVRLLVQEITPQTSEPSPLNLKPIFITIEPPQIDLPIGKPVPPQPMVVIEARFLPEVALTILASQYPADIGSLSDIYHAQVSVQIFEDGAVGDVYIVASDGNTSIDNFIINYAKSHWHFLPALSDGVPSLSWKSVNLEMTSAALVVVN